MSRRLSSAKRGTAAAEFSVAILLSRSTRDSQSSAIHITSGLQHVRIHAERSRNKFDLRQSLGCSWVRQVDVSSVELGREGNPRKAQTEDKALCLCAQSQKNCQARIVHSKDISFVFIRMALLGFIPSSSCSSFVLSLIHGTLSTNPKNIDRFSHNGSIAQHIPSQPDIVPWHAPPSNPEATQGHLPMNRSVLDRSR